MSARSAWALLCLLLALPTWGQEEGPRADPEVARVRTDYEYGKYQDVLTRAQTRIDQGSLTPEELAELHKYAGLAAFNLGLAKDAERHLVALLRLEPDYSLDPFIFPPPALQLFERLRRQDAPQLDAIRQEKRAEAIRRRTEREERERARVQAEEQRRRIEELSRKITVRTVERRSFLVNFVPFGAGQFQQGRNSLGIVLAASEGALAAGSLIGYFAYESLYTSRTITLDDRQTPSGKFTLTYYGIPTEREGEANAWRLLKTLSAAGFYVLYGYGVVDALLHHQDQVVTTHVEELPLSGPEEQPPHLSRRPPAPPRPDRLSAYLFPLPGGAGAGLSLNF